MATSVTIKDASPTGKVSHQRKLSVPSSVLTVEELIKIRVFQEVKSYNEQMPDYINSLVQPSQEEKILNGIKVKARRQIDAEQQYYLALDFFQKNGFFILVDDRQVSELQTKIVVKEDTEISFIKLTPLVGG